MFVTLGRLEIIVVLVIFFVDQDRGRLCCIGHMIVEKFNKKIAVESRSDSTALFLGELGEEIMTGRSACYAFWR